MWTLSTETDQFGDFLYLNAGGWPAELLREAECLEVAGTERKCRMADDFTPWNGENGDTHRGEDYKGHSGEKNCVSFIFNETQCNPAVEVIAAANGQRDNKHFIRAASPFLSLFCFVLWLQYSDKSLLHADAKEKTAKSEWCLDRHIKFWSTKGILSSLKADVQNWTWK